MKTVHLYSKEDCHLCEEAKATLVAAAARVPFDVQVVDVERFDGGDPEFGVNHHQELPGQDVVGL